MRKMKTKLIRGSSTFETVRNRSNSVVPCDVENMLANDIWKDLMEYNL